MKEIKPPLHAVGSANEAPNPFTPENLRLNQSFTEMVAVRKVLSTVPIRKPSLQDFVRVHPTHRENFPILDFKDDREEYVVQSDIVPELISEIVNKTLYLAITKQGTVFLWPVRLPGADGKDMDWWRSAREAAERATQSWVRVKANTNLGAYDITEAAGDLGEPEWPEPGFWDIVRIAFKDRLIQSTDHPAIKRLRGLG
jgi:hypothetical protein